MQKSASQQIHNRLFHTKIKLGLLGIVIVFVSSTSLGAIGIANVRGDCQSELAKAKDIIQWYQADEFCSRKYLYTFLLTFFMSLPPTIGLSLLVCNHMLEIAQRIHDDDLRSIDIES
jgi:hypothetical protein